MRIIWNSACNFRSYRGSIVSVKSILKVPVVFFWQCVWKEQMQKKSFQDKIVLQIEHLKIYISHLKIYISHEYLHFSTIIFKSNFWEQHFKRFGLSRSFVGLISLVRKILKTHFYGWSSSHTLHIFIIHSSIFSI